MTFHVDLANVIQAVSHMAEALHEYNRGVLAMLGREQLAIDYRADHNEMTRLTVQREALPASIFDSHHSPEYNRLTTEINKASASMATSWAPIQSLIDEARKARVTPSQPIETTKMNNAYYRQEND